MSRTLFVLQGGGPTPVINATLAGIAEQAVGTFDRLYGLRHSFEPDSAPRVVNLTSLLNPVAASSINVLARTPGALLGSSRKKVSDQHLLGLLDVLRTCGATDLIGIGGNGTMSVLDRLSDVALAGGYPLSIVGAPKTVDNDLPGVYAAPGYGSAARFVAMAVRDYDCDFRAMSTFDSVTILETMGRNSGWLAAAASLLKQTEEDAPHIVLLPERPFDEGCFLDTVSQYHSRYGRVFIVTNEMLNDTHGAIVGEAVQNGPRDALGRAMYSLSSGTGNYLADLIWRKLDLQSRCLRPGNLSRALSCCVSEPDRALARAVGRQAIDIVPASGGQGRMITVDDQLQLATQDLKLAAAEKPLAEKYLCRQTAFQIDPSFSKFALPLIGEVAPLFDYRQFDHHPDS